MKVTEELIKELVLEELQTEGKVMDYFKRLFGMMKPEGEIADKLKELAALAAKLEKADPQSVEYRKDWWAAMLKGFNKYAKGLGKADAAGQYELEKAINEYILNLKLKLAQWQEMRKNNPFIRNMDFAQEMGVSPVSTMGAFDFREGKEKISLKITNKQLNKIIEEELTSVLDERTKAKDFIKDPQIHTSIPIGMLLDVFNKAPDGKRLALAATNPANPMGQRQAFQKIAQLMGDMTDPNFGKKMKDVLDIPGYLQHAEQAGIIQRWLSMQ